MTDALVARLTRTAGDLAAAGPEGAVIRGDKTLAFATDISALLTAYATVQTERDAAREDVRRLIKQNDETTREWGEDVTRLRAALATMRERLAGEVEKEKLGDGEDCLFYNTALDLAITIIKGTK